MENPVVQFVFNSIVFVTPLLIVLMGELLLQRSGLVNFGLNGIILLSAVLSIVIYDQTQQLFLAGIGAMAIAMLLTIVLGFVNLQLKLPILVSGFLIAIFGQNLARFIGNDFVFDVGSLFHAINLPGISDLPIFGKIFFQHTAWVYFAHLLVLGVWLWVFKSRFGKVLIGLGDNPDGLFRRGYKITHIRYAYLCFAGALAGLSGFLYIFLVDLGWRGSYSSFDGIGWFVFALLMIGNWKPGRTLLYAYLYTFMSLGFQVFQSSQTVFSVTAINLLPQAIIIFILAGIYFGKRRWMITPINKILSQEYTFIKRLGENVVVSTQPQTEIKNSSEG